MKTKSLLAIMSALAFAPSAFATSFTISGSFSGTGAVAPTSIEASFAGTFDDTGVSMSGVSLVTGTVDGFLLSPNPFGTTTVGLSDVALGATFFDGTLIAVNFRGLAGAATSGQDGFFVQYFANGLLQSAGWSSANELSINTFDSSGGGNSQVTGSATISAVPLPAAAWLFLSAIAGLFGIKRLRT